MQNLLDTLKKATDFLSRKGLEKPRLEAEHLFAAGLGVRRLDLYLQFERLLNDTEVEKLRAMTVRRGNREPLQHIVGTVSFRDLILKSDKRALIPRPETEELVDLALALFSAEQVVRVLDLGTGSGAIALALAAERPLWRIDALDKSTDALSLARENAIFCQLESRINFIQSDWFAVVTDQYDLIISNPPYLAENEITTAEPEVRAFDPYSALVAADNGLADLKIILTNATKFLKKGGWVICETGIDQHSALAEISKQNAYKEYAGVNDLSGRPRFWKAQKSV